MPLIKMQFRPGVDRDQTAYSGEGGWFGSNLIRFHSGYPEKMGGWEKYTNNTFIGVCRNMWNWVTSYVDNLLFLGTHVKAYIENGGIFWDITPLRDVTPTITTPNTNNCVTTANGSKVVTITLAIPHLAETGSYVVISGIAAPIGGIPAAEINGNHKITVVSPTVFTFLALTTATSTAGPAGGVAISVSFEIPPGNASTVYGYGWGTGTWGHDGGWGSGSTTPVYLPQRDWWGDNFDNDLVANIRNGPIYYWERGLSADPDTALGVKLQHLSFFAARDGFDATAVPVKVMQSLVSQNDKHLLAFGAVPLGSTNEADFDPLLIRWANQDSPFEWLPSPINSAGDLRVSRGSAIIRALPTRQEILVWTDSNLYTLQFLGTTDVFGLQEYANNISIMSPRACISANNVTYWMGKDKFYSFSGVVDTLPCTLRNHVFRNINFGQSAQVVCGTSEEWNEVWWFYPSLTSTWNDSYVVYNTAEKCWYYGAMERTAWLDTPLRDNPQSCFTAETDESGFLYNQERGVDADGAPMDAFITSADYDIGDGDQFMLTTRIIPDVDFGGSSSLTPEVKLQIYTHRAPGAPYLSDAADTKRVISATVNQYTTQVFLRARSRQMAFRIRSDTLGVHWELGSPRIDTRPDGRR